MRESPPSLSRLAQERPDGRCLEDQVSERLWGDRFGEMIVQLCLAGQTSILLPSIAGDGDQGGVPQALLLAQPAGDFIAVHAWQPDIQQDNVWHRRECRFDRGRTIVD